METLHNINAQVIIKDPEKNSESSQLNHQNESESTYMYSYMTMSNKRGSVCTHAESITSARSYVCQPLFATCKMNAQKCRTLSHISLLQHLFALKNSVTHSVGNGGQKFLWNCFVAEIQHSSVVRPYIRLAIYLWKARMHIIVVTTWWHWTGTQTDRQNRQLL